MTWHPWHETFFVYLLLDPHTDLVQYVGITTDPYARVQTHWRTAIQEYRGQTKLRLWLRMNRELGYRPQMLMIEKVQGVMAARQREAYYIDLYTKLGRRLLNMANMPIQERLI